ncbi:MAG: hypothetical protein M0C28_41465 [Candidatus Moduliflexus flocculans]|nr:hypothetical protein [Candidatus Moduliflexus flocculans]
MAPGYMATNNTAALRADAGAEQGHPGPHPRGPLGHPGGSFRARRSSWPPGPRTT